MQNIYIASVFADDLKFRDKFETQQELQKSTQYNFCEMGFSLWRCFVWIRTETHSLFDVSLSFSVEKSQVTIYFTSHKCFDLTQKGFTNVLRPLNIYLTFLSYHFYSFQCIEEIDDLSYGDL